MPASASASGTSLTPAQITAITRAGGNSMVAAAGLGLGIQPSAATKQARRLYVGGIPIEIVEAELQLFFNNALKRCDKSSRPGDAAISVYINREKKFAFVEFRSMEEATASMSFDGIEFRGQQLKVRRPSDYSASNFPPQGAIPILDLSALGIVSTQVDDGPNKVFCGGLPYQLDDDDVRELVSTWGTLKSFHMVRDRDTGIAKGFCFLEYGDPDITDDAIEGLNNLEIAGKELSVRRAGKDNDGQPPVMMPTAAPSVFSQTPTNVLVMHELVTDAELQDDNEYTEVYEDVADECRQYGQLHVLLIPRPVGPGQRAPGQGKVYAQFGTKEQAEAAREEIEGREFDGRVVSTVYMDETAFKNRQLD